MISQYDVSRLLRKEIPSFANNFYPATASTGVYAIMNYFSDYTRQMVKANEMSIARKCFQLADKLFRQGDRIVRALTENVFVYSFSSMLCEDDEKRKSIRELIPASLYSVYINQVTKSGA
jgi:hypothetical protein